MFVSPLVNGLITGNVDIWKCVVKSGSIFSLKELLVVVREEEVQIFPVMLQEMILQDVSL